MIPETSMLSIPDLTADVIHKINQIRIWYEMTPESDLRGVLKLLEEYPKVCVNFQIVGFFRLFYETSLPSKISSISRAVTIKGYISFDQVPPRYSRIISLL